MHTREEPTWSVDLHADFLPELEALSESVQDELLAHVALLEHFGPRVGRPRVGTLRGSRHANMKELRFDADGGAWRFAFAFNPRRQAILLCGGDKSGRSERRFYRRLIEKADDRFDAHLTQLAQPQMGRRRGRSKTR